MENTTDVERRTAAVEELKRKGVGSGSSGSEVRTYAAEHDFKFRKPVCPYCGGKLIASANCWEQETDGSWIASEVQVECDSEPDIDGPDWEEWWRAHSYDYCDGWRTVADRILAWMKRHARFNLPNSEVSQMHSPRSSI